MSVFVTSKEGMEKRNMRQSAIDNTLGGIRMILPSGTSYYTTAVFLLLFRVFNLSLESFGFLPIPPHSF